MYFLAILYVFRICTLAGRTRPHFAERVCPEGISPTVSGSCGKDPPIAHTHLATVLDAVAERVKNRLFRTDAHQCTIKRSSNSNLLETKFQFVKTMFKLINWKEGNKTKILALVSLDLD